VKSVSEVLHLKLPRLLKCTVSGKEFHILDNSYSKKKSIASAIVTVCFIKFICMSSSLTSIAKFKNILEIYCNQAKHNLITV